MATIKAYTTIEQSRKLAEILPLESADMYYREWKRMTKDIRIAHVGSAGEKDLPCWSLAALLGVLPFPVLYMEMLGGMILWSCECHFMETDEVVKIEHYNNPVDACYELILKLNELNLL